MRESYVPNFKVPARKQPSSVMWLTLLFCIVLPPLGLILLWGRARCPLRGKLWISSISVLILVGLMTFLLNWREQSNYVPPQVPVTVYGGATTDEPASTAAPAPEQAQQPGGEAEADDEVIIPGNPIS